MNSTSTEAARGLFDAIAAAWGEDTSADPEHWTPNNPAYGQCAVTALIVNDHLGGTLLRTTVDGVSHYYNWLPDGREVDLTWRQFREVAVVGDVIERERDYVLSFSATQERYERLAGRVAELLRG